MYKYTCLCHKLGVAPCGDQQNFKIPHNFTISTCCFDENFAVDFLQKECVSRYQAPTQKRVFYATPGSFLLILLHFFLFAFKNATQYLIVLLISHNIDKIHTKYQTQNAAITLFYELELFCQHTFISSARLIHKSRASRTLQVILTVRIWRSQFTKDLTSWHKLNGQ